MLVECWSKLISTLFTIHSPCWIFNWKKVQICIHQSAVIPFYISLCFPFSTFTVLFPCHGLWSDRALCCSFMMSEQRRMAADCSMYVPADRLVVSQWHYITPELAAMRLAVTEALWLQLPCLLLSFPPSTQITPPHFSSDCHPVSPPLPCAMLCLLQQQWSNSCQRFSAAGDWAHLFVWFTELSTRTECVEGRETQMWLRMRN